MREDEKRDWTAPRDPGALVGLLRAFAAMAAAAGGRSVMVASCPSWFDDCGFASRDVAKVARSAVETSGGWWDSWEADEEGPFGAGDGAVARPVSTPESRAARRRERIEESISRLAPPSCDADLFRSLLAAVNDGALSRDAVEAALHPLEAEEIAAFHLEPGGMPELLVAHTNGYTDVAYALAPDGRLLCWPALDSDEAVKEDMFPSRQADRIGPTDLGVPPETGPSVA